MKQKNKTVRFYGNMEWFDVDDDVDGINFPPEFNQAKMLWVEDSEKNLEQVIKLLAPFVRAWFVPAGIFDSEDIFPDQSDIDAVKINVVGIDFSKEPFPLCKVEAWFDVPVSETFSTLDIDDWQNETGQYFYQAISFGWEVPTKEGEPLIFTYGNHQGVECIPEVTG
jgi:hypothetical protein